VLTTGEAARVSPWTSLGVKKRALQRLPDFPGIARRAQLCPDNSHEEVSDGAAGFLWLRLTGNKCTY